MHALSVHVNEVNVSVLKRVCHRGYQPNGNKKKIGKLKEKTARIVTISFKLCQWLVCVCVCVCVRARVCVCEFAKYHTCYTISIIAICTEN